MGRRAAMTPGWHRLAAAAVITILHYFGLLPCVLYSYKYKYKYERGADDGATPYAVYCTDEVFNNHPLPLDALLHTVHVLYMFMYAIRMSV
jgi:hypothetical protein